ncbi:YeeE/YedE family protein [Thalassospira alkalitolerans]|uniref:YeeE/YedE family protein n=1 Tax=Thalassospira alkalitolerans TaxID=1293890 RepID=UPI003AA83FA8
MSEASVSTGSKVPGFTFDKGPAAVIAILFVIVAVLISRAVDIHQGVLYGLGGLLGFALYHASFGFTGGWRRFSVERRGRAMRAQLLMIGVAAAAFIPLLAIGSPLGTPIVGAIAPVGVSVVVGAFMFGLGMQLGGGCGSGTLFTVGGGSARMLLTLAFFIIGAVIGTAHLPMWLEFPSLPAISLGREYGIWGGLGVTFGGLGLIALITIWVEKRAHGSLETLAHQPTGFGLRRLLHGPWPLVATGVLLAGLNVATLLTAGHPWSITFGFGLWGAKIAQGFGIPVETWEFWNWAGPAKALSNSVLADNTSVMNFGIVIGAALAASLAGKFAPRVKVPFSSLLAAAIGGILMGYGARLAFGCNIGAFFSGIASGSLHGWLWFVAAFAGSWIGVALRPVFGMDGFKKS